MKLQYKISLYLFLFSLIFLGASTAIFYVHSGGLALRSAHETLGRFSEQVAHQVDYYLAGKADMVRVLSNANVISAALSASNKECAAVPEGELKDKMRRLNEKWMAADPDDPFVSNLMTNASAEYLRKQAKSIPGEFGEIFLTNRYGAVVGTTNKLTTYAHAHKYWWQAAYRDGKGRVFFDDRGFDESAKGYVVGVVIPIFEEGEISGILKANLNIMGSLSRILWDLPYSGIIDIKLVRTGGRIVMEEGAPPLSTKLTAKLTKKLAAFEEGSKVITEKGVKRVAAYYPVELTQGTEKYGFGGKYKSIDHIEGNEGEGWAVVVSEDYDLVMMNHTKAAKQILFISAFFTLMLVILAAWFGYRLSKPIVSLSDHIKDAGKRKFDTHIDISSADEIGQLAISYNRMIDELKETTASRDDLAEAEREAKEANRAKSEFLANMSHEIRTPMQSIIGMTEVLAETELTKDQKYSVDILKKAGDNLLDIVSDILDLSKIEAGRFEIEEKPFSPVQLKKETLKLFEASAKKKGLKLDCHISGEVPETVSGDVIRIRQVLVNLLGNAVKFTEKGEITLDLEAVKDKKSTLRFSVIDTGVGIDSAMMEHIFEPFSQADASFTRRHSGTGLGLTISKSIIELMGGELFVESTPGKGSRFSFHIPLKEVGKEEREREDSILKPSGAEHLSLNLLVVEDAEDIRLLLKIMLKGTGCKLDMAENGEEGVEKFKKGNYNLVLMDIQMPVMDGLAATEAIREYEKSKGLDPTPVIALTAHAFKEEADKCLAAGCTAHLGKPVRKAALLQVISEYAPSNAV